MEKISPSPKVQVPTFVNGNLNLDAARFRPPTRGVEIVQGVPAVAAASLAVSSTPAGADIYLDGQFVGNTPSTLNVTGSHTVAVKKNGFQDWTRQMSFSGGSITLNAELIVGTGKPIPVRTDKVTTETAATVPVAKTFTVQQVGPSKDLSSTTKSDNSQGSIGVTRSTSEAAERLLQRSPQAVQLKKLD